MNVDLARLDSGKDVGVVVKDTSSSAIPEESVTYPVKKGRCLTRKDFAPAPAP